MSSAQLHIESKTGGGWFLASQIEMKQKLLILQETMRMAERQADKQIDQ